MAGSGCRCWPCRGRPLTLERVNQPRVPVLQSAAGARCSGNPDDTGVLRRLSGAGDTFELMRLLWTLLCGLLLAAQAIAAQPDYAQNIASLIDPAKLATLGKSGANTRVQKAVYWLA